MVVEWSSKIFKWIFPAIWNIEGSGKFVCLTFDDGPESETTPKVLDLLEKYDIQATFFCVGENVRKNPDLFSKIKRRGHAVGNHTMHHLKGFECSVKSYLQDIEEANQLIGSKLFRPPYGRMRLSQFIRIRKLYKVVMWDVITRDYNQSLTPDKCLNITKRYVRNGSIIVFHDSKKAAKNMLQALPQTIEWLLSEGYEFRLIDEK